MNMTTVGDTDQMAKPLVSNNVASSGKSQQSSGSVITPQKLANPKFSIISNQIIRASPNTVGVQSKIPNSSLSTSMKSSLKTSKLNSSNKGSIPSKLNPKAVGNVRVTKLTHSKLASKLGQIGIAKTVKRNLKEDPRHVLKKKTTVEKSNINNSKIHHEPSKLNSDPNSAEWQLDNFIKATKLTDSKSKMAQLGEDKNATSNALKQPSILDNVLTKPTETKAPSNDDTKSANQPVDNVLQSSSDKAASNSSKSTKKKKKRFRNLHCASDDETPFNTQDSLVMKTSTPSKAKRLPEGASSKNKVSTKELNPAELTNVEADASVISDDSITSIYSKMSSLSDSSVNEAFGEKQCTDLEVDEKLKAEAGGVGEGLILPDAEPGEIICALDEDGNEIYMQRGEGDQLILLSVENDDQLENINQLASENASVEVASAVNVKGSAPETALPNDDLSKTNTLSQSSIISLEKLKTNSTEDSFDESFDLSLSTDTESLPANTKKNDATSQSSVDSISGLTTDDSLDESFELLAEPVDVGNEEIISEEEEDLAEDAIEIPVGVQETNDDDEEEQPIYILNDASATTTPIQLALVQALGDAKGTNSNILLLNKAESVLSQGEQVQLEMLSAMDVPPIAADIDTILQAQDQCCIVDYESSDSDNDYNNASSMANLNQMSHTDITKVVLGEGYDAMLVRDENKAVDLLKHPPDYKPRPLIVPVTVAPLISGVQGEPKTSSHREPPKKAARKEKTTQKRTKMRPLHVTGDCDTEDSISSEPSPKPKRNRRVRSRKSSEGNLLSSSQSDLSLDEFNSTPVKKTDDVVNADKTHLSEKAKNLLYLKHNFKGSSAEDSDVSLPVKRRKRRRRNTELENNETRLLSTDSKLIPDTKNNLKETDINENDPTSDDSKLNGNKFTDHTSSASSVSSSKPRKRSSFDVPSFEGDVNSPRVTRSANSKSVNISYNDFTNYDLNVIDALEQDDHNTIAVESSELPSEEITKSKADMESVKSKVSTSSKNPSVKSTEKSPKKLIKDKVASAPKSGVEKTTLKKVVKDKTVPALTKSSTEDTAKKVSKEKVTSTPKTNKPLQKKLKVDIKNLISKSLTKDKKDEKATVKPSKLKLKPKSTTVESEITPLSEDMAEGDQQAPIAEIKDLSHSDDDVVYVKDNTNEPPIIINDDPELVINLGGILNQHKQEMIDGEMIEVDPYYVGDLVLARLSTFCYWPAMITVEPTINLHRRAIGKYFTYHVRFFGDNGRRAWIHKQNILRYKGPDTLKNYRASLVERKKQRKFDKLLAKEITASTVNSKSQKSWNIGISEIESLVDKTVADRHDFFFHMFSSKRESRKRKRLISSDFDVKPAKEDLLDISTSGDVTPKSKKRKIEETADPTESSVDIPETMQSDTVQSESLVSLPSTPSEGPKKKKKRSLSTKKLTTDGSDKTNYVLEDLEMIMKGVQDETDEPVNASSEVKEDVVPKKRPYKRKSSLPTKEDAAIDKTPDLKLPIKTKLQSDLTSEVSDTDSSSKLSVQSTGTRRILFKDVPRIPVCQNCLSNKGIVLKCKGKCCGFYHADCSDLQTELKDEKEITDTPATPGGLQQSGSDVSVELKSKDSSTLLDSPGNTVAKSDDAPKEKKTVDDNFLCVNCKHDIEPCCFACGSSVYMNEHKPRYKCSVNGCGKYYHRECLNYWPQTIFDHSKNNKTIFKCPMHSCHTCVCYKPKSYNGVLPIIKTTRCLKCPATYHIDSFCIPAGTEILSQTQIICPRHVQHKVKRYTINGNWCFICSRGGNLVCCETCPTSVHQECITVNLRPDDTFVCEECESGRLPLYDDIVWAKFAHFKWWPGVILFPEDIPDVVKQTTHRPGEFVVQFYGTHDHHWFALGRVFLFQEDDKDTLQNRKDSSFMKAIGEARAAYSYKMELKKQRALAKRKSEKPPPYQRIRVNRLIGNLKPFDGNVSNTNACNCDQAMPNPCGPDADCLNRLLMTECNPDNCPAGPLCQNQRFDKQEYPHLTAFMTETRGWGLRCTESIAKGQFIIEYVGEVIDKEEYQRRIKIMNEEKTENYYFLTIDSNRTIDAGPKGNLARFMNHCCEPNCETQKWTVNRDTRVGLFALDDIPANTELTFNYNLESFGGEKRVCNCGATNCSGFLGVKNKVKKKLLSSKLPEVQTIPHPCFLCGELNADVECTMKTCLKAYHLRCLEFQIRPQGKWVCPRHYCNACAKRTIRSCSKCLQSYCPLHSQGKIQFIENLGYVCNTHDLDHQGDTAIPRISPLKEAHEPNMNT